MHRFFALLLLLAFGLTACQGAPARPTSLPASLTTATVIAQITQAASESCYYFEQPTPRPNDPSLFAPVSAQDHIKGPADAYLTILEYSDFQCTACAAFAATLVKIQEKHAQDIRLVYRSFPLITLNDKAALSMQAAEAAHLQGKFWEMHDLLFEKQVDWVQLDPAAFRAWLATQAGTLGLDVARFSSDLTSPAISALPQKAWQDGMNIKLPGVPLILVNGEILKWQPGLVNNLESLINLYLLPKRQFKRCPPLVIDTAKQYVATLKTAKGDIVIRLFADQVPNTVNNFVFLARSGWYDNTIFYSVIPGFAAQTGDPTGTGQGNPGYFLPDENLRAAQYDRPGLVGMNNSGPDTGASEFFITYAPAAKLNGKYTLFGEVISGMDVLQQLTARDAKPGQPLPDGDLLISVTIEEK